LALLGALGAAADERIGIDALLACGRRDHLVIGGCTPTTTLSLPDGAWARLGAEPAAHTSGAGLVGAGRFQCLQGGDALPIASGEEYPFRQGFGIAGQAHQERQVVTLPGRFSLVIINQFAALNWMDRVRVSVNGARRLAAWDDPITRIYPCTNCEGDVEWEVSYRVQRPDQVYLVAVELAPISRGD
jgi:hypothetical protein